MARAARGSLALAGLAGAGLVASLLVAWSACAAGAHPAAGAGTFPGERWAADAVGLPSAALARGSWYGGVLGLGLAWVALVAVVNRRAQGASASPVPVRAVAAVVVLWAAPLLLVPPVGSRDVYSYVAHGELAAAGRDPGAVTPTEGLDPGSPAYRSVDPIWRGVVSAYGPLAVGLSEAAVRLSGHDVVGAVLWERLWAVVGVGLLGVGLVVLARAGDGDIRGCAGLPGGTGTAKAGDGGSRGGRLDGAWRHPSVVVAVALASPVTIVHLIGGAHNEGLMMGLGVLGLALVAVSSRRTGPGRWLGWAVGLVLVGLGAAVKVTIVVAAAYLGWNAPRGDGPDQPTRRRTADTVVAGAIALATVAGVGLATGRGWGWVGGAGAGGKVITLLSVTSTLGALVVAPFVDSTRAVLRSLVYGAVRAAGLAVAAALSAVLLWRSPRRGVDALGWILLTLALLGPAVHPWYLAWGLPLLALHHQGRAEPWLFALVVAAAGATKPGGGGAWPNIGLQPWRLVVVVLVTGAVAVLVRGVAKRSGPGPAPVAPMAAPSCAGSAWPGARPVAPPSSPGSEPGAPTAPPSSFGSEPGAPTAPPSSSGPVRS